MHYHLFLVSLILLSSFERHSADSGLGCFLCFVWLQVSGVFELLVSSRTATNGQDMHTSGVSKEHTHAKVSKGRRLTMLQAGPDIRLRQTPWWPSTAVWLLPWHSADATVFVRSCDTEPTSVVRSQLSTVTGRGGRTGNRTSSCNTPPRSIILYLRVVADESKMPLHMSKMKASKIINWLFVWSSCLDFLVSLTCYLYTLLVGMFMRWLSFLWSMLVASLDSIRILLEISLEQLPNQCNFQRVINFPAIRGEIIALRSDKFEGNLWLKSKNSSKYYYGNVAYCITHVSATTVLLGWA